MAVKLKGSLGDVIIEQDVVATIVGGAAIENPGVVGVVSKAIFRDGMSDVLKRENYNKGVVISQNNNDIVIDVYIVAQFGLKLNNLAQSVRQKIVYNLDDMLGIHVSQVNVIIQGVKTGKYR